LRSDAGADVARSRELQIGAFFKTIALLRPGATPVVLPRIIDAAYILRWSVAGLSVHPAANRNGRPWRHHTGSGPHNGSCNDRGGAACGDAACANDATRADNGACVHRAQGDDASCQQ
jgi:hypothetical protein